MLDEFGSLAGVLAGSSERLIALTQSNHIAHRLSIVREAMLQSAADAICDRPIIATSDTLVAYVKAHIAAAPAETVRVLFLDARLHLLRDEPMFHGSITEVPIYPREIIRRALELRAASLIVVHNHPSGDSAPSQADLECTRQLRDAAVLFNLTLVDHLVISEFGCHSMRSAGSL